MGLVRKVLWLVVAACGGEPKLEATTGRHVIIEIDSVQQLEPCTLPCGRAARPRERVVHCGTDNADYLRPQLGPIAQAYAMCSFAGGGK
ncbi:MAG: hypothetical protein H0T42_30215 [Deltaproteobacteria bacterium]|nr:hypothetical protein [Deltaproteobacteria bacterium]